MVVTLEPSSRSNLPWLTSNLLREGGDLMRWLPAPRNPIWWRFAAVLAVVQFAAMGLAIHFLLPHAQPRYFFIALFCLITGLVIGGLGWLGARWFSLFSTLGLAVGLAVMISSFTGNGGWEDLIGLLSLLVFLFGGAVLGLLVDLTLWVYRRAKAR